MSLYRLVTPPEALHEPVLVVGLEGWIDAGLGATTAIASLLASLESEVVAEFDTDELLDHRARRPIVRISDGVNTGLTWPELQLRSAEDTNGTRFLLLVGPEPDHRWRAFVDDVAELATTFGVRLAVGLGAFPAPVPHTRPVRLAATATTLDLAQEIGYVPGTMDVPAGAQAAIERRLFDAGIPAVGLWARVPHYVAAMPYPSASAALLDSLASLAGLAIDTSELQRAGDEALERIEVLVGQNPDHVELVRRLEAQLDSESDATRGVGFGDIPTGDEIAAELERFLRGQD